MPARRGLRRVIGMLCAATIAAALGAVGPSVSAPRAGATSDSWHPLLARIPASGTFADSVIINDYAAAREAAGVKRTADRVRYLLTLERRTGVASSELLRASGPGDPLAEELGIRSRDVDRDVVAGSPPDGLTILEGAFDADQVRRALKADESFSDLLRTARHGGARYYTWEPSRVDPKRRTPLRPLGAGGNLAVDTPYAAWSDAAATIEASIDAAAGTNPSLIDNPDLAAVSVALQDRGSYAGFLSTREVAPGAPTGGPAPLAPYAAIAIGPTLEDTKHPDIVVVLAYADDATARTQADRLRSIAATGTSLGGTPWSDLLGVVDIANDGRIVVGRFTTEDPQRWLDIVLRRDSLLATCMIG